MPWIIAVFLICVAIFLWGILALAASAWGLLAFGLGSAVSFFLSRKKPTVPEADEFLSSADRATAWALRAEQGAIQVMINECHAEADRLNLARRAHDETRFDGRKRDAKRINALLDSLEQKLESVTVQYVEISEAAEDRFRDWLKRAERWSTLRSAGAAFFAALLVYGAAFSVLNWTQPDWVSRLSTFTGGNGVSPGARVGAFGIAVCLGGIVWPLRRRSLRIPMPDFADFRAPWEAEEQASENENLDDGASEWHSVLGVQADATVEKIKAAYHEQIKQYHPDKVATMGPRIRSVAEEQTRLLIAAYEKGLKSHGQSKAGPI